MMTGKLLFFLLLCLAVGALYVLVLRRPAPAPTVTAALQALQRDELAFLVTDRVVTTLVVDSREHGAFLGASEAYLIATVTLYYGADLKQLTEADARREGDRLVVAVPEPVELEFAVDLGSLRTLTKRTGLMVLRDWIQGIDTERALYAILHDNAARTLERHGLAPTRASLVQRLNAYAPALSERVGMAVVFE